MVYWHVVIVTMNEHFVVGDVLIGHCKPLTIKVERGEFCY